MGDIFQSIRSTLEHLCVRYGTKRRPFAIVLGVVEFKEFEDGYVTDRRCLFDVVGGRGYTYQFQNWDLPIVVVAAESYKGLAFEASDVQIPMQEVERANARV